MENLSAETVHEPVIKRNLLASYADREGSVKTIHASVRSLFSLCPRKEEFEQLLDPNLDLDAIPSDILDAANDYVVRIGSASGWEVNEQDKEVVEASLARQKLESNFTFTQSSVQAPASAERSVAGHKTKQDEQSKQDKNAVSKNENTFSPSLKKPENMSPVSVVGRKVIAKQQPAAAHTVPEQAKQGRGFAPEPARAAIAATMQERQLAIKALEHKAKKPFEMVMRPAPKAPEQKDDRPKTSFVEIVQRPVDTTKKVLAKAVPKLKLAGPKIERKITLSTFPITTKLVVETKPNPAASNTHPASKPPKVVGAPLAPRAKPVEAQTAARDIQSAANFEADSAAEALYEAPVWEVAFAQEPLRAEAEPRVVTLETLLSFEDDLFAEPEASFALPAVFDGETTHVSVPAHEQVIEKLSFSQQLESFVAATLAAKEQAEATTLITEVRELVEQTIEGAIELELNVVALPELTLEAAVDLKLSDELLGKVTALLQMLGEPEPSQRHIRQCVAKFQVEAIQKLQRHAIDQQIHDILHEHHSMPSVLNFTQTILSADFHKLLGQLAVYTPAKV